MRKYETVFISDPDLKDQARTELFDKVRSIIAGEKGILLDFDEWGNKKLAYEIRKKFRGHYVCATYGGTGDLVMELERNFRLTDNVLKFMTIVLSEDTAVEVFEKEVADAKAAAEPVEETAPDTASEEKAPAVEETPKTEETEAVPVVKSGEAEKAVETVETVETVEKTTSTES